MNRFVFLDSSGIIAQDRFFGVGMLTVAKTGALSDMLSKIYQWAYYRAKINKEAAISEFLRKGKQDEATNILRSSKRFELKFDKVRSSQVPYYQNQKMIDVFFF